MNAVAKDAGFQVTYSGATLDGLTTLLQAKSIDVIATVWTSTPARDAVADYSTPVDVFGELPLVKKGDTSSYKSLMDLKGKTVSPAIYETQLRASGVGANVLPNCGTTACILDEVRTGKSDTALFTSATTAFFATAPNSQFDMPKGYTPTFTQPLSLAVRKGDSALLTTLNASLKKLMADGTVKAIWAKYGLDWTQPKA